MTKIVSYAYRPDGDAESERVEMESLRRGFPLILLSLDRILRTPRFFFCQLQSAYTWALWVGPTGPIPLGVLVLLWENGTMIYGCPDCSSRVYALGVGGSLTRGEVWGLCAGCSSNGDFIPKSWHDGILWSQGFFPIARLLPFYQNEPIIEYEKRPRFSWKYGLVGETTPDKVLVPPVEPVPLTQLLAELEAAEAGAAIPDDQTEPVQPRRVAAPTVFLQLQKGQGVLKVPLAIGDIDKRNL